jgi:hypothetical protein
MTRYHGYLPDKQIDNCVDDYDAGPSKIDMVCFGMMFIGGLYLTARGIFRIDILSLFGHAGMRIIWSMERSVHDWLFLKPRFETIVEDGEGTPRKYGRF